MQSTYTTKLNNQINQAPKGAFLWVKTMSREITVNSGDEQCSIEMVIEVLDEEKFKSSMAEVNQFWSGHKARKNIYGSDEKAGFLMFCAECFQIVAFNDFLNEKYLTKKLDWSQPDCGVEGYPSTEQAGIRIKKIESWFIDYSLIELTGWE